MLSARCSTPVEILPVGPQLRCSDAAGQRPNLDRDVMWRTSMTAIDPTRTGRHARLCETKGLGQQQPCDHGKHPSDSDHSGCAPGARKLGPSGRRRGRLGSLLFNPCPVSVVSKSCPGWAVDSPQGLNPVSGFPQSTTDTGSGTERSGGVVDSSQGPKPVSGFPQSTTDTGSGTERSGGWWIRRRARNRSRGSRSPRPTQARAQSAPGGWWLRTGSML